MEHLCMQLVRALATQSQSACLVLGGAQGSTIACEVLPTLYPITHAAGAQASGGGQAPHIPHTLTLTALFRVEVHIHHCASLCIIVLSNDTQAYDAACAVCAMNTPPRPTGCTALSTHAAWCCNAPGA